MKYETSKLVNPDRPDSTDKPEEKPAQQKSVPTVASRSTPLILVVDDEADNLVVLSLELQRSGYRVLTAANGEEAVKLAVNAKPDLIVMDIAMPVMDGFGAARSIRANAALTKVPIVALSAFTTEGFRRSAYDVDMDGYLTKPVDFDRLHYLISGLIARAQLAESEDKPRTSAE